MGKGFHLEKWVTTRADHVCEVCGGIVQKGARMFYRQGRDDTGYYRNHTCETCENKKTEGKQ